MRSLRIVALIVGLVALGYYLYQTFGNPNGKSYALDKHHHVYYKGDGLKEDDAKKTADYFKEIGYFGADNTSDVQLITTKDKVDEVTLKFIVDKNKLTSEMESAYLTLGSAINQQVFPSKHIVVALADEHMNDIKNLGTAKPLTAEPSDTTRMNQ